jgi:hypothetical protein
LNLWQIDSFSTTVESVRKREERETERGRGRERELGMNE